MPAISEPCTIALPDNVLHGLHPLLVLTLAR
jgi:hypothetical protein